MTTLLTFGETLKQLRLLLCDFLHSPLIFIRSGSAGGPE